MATVYDYQQNHTETDRNVQQQQFEQNTLVYQPGDPQTHIRLIGKGAVKIGSYPPEGDRVVYDVLQPGEFFGDLSYLETDNVEFFEFARTSTSAAAKKYRPQLGAGQFQPRQPDPADSDGFQRHDPPV